MGTQRVKLYQEPKKGEEPKVVKAEEEGVKEEKPQVKERAPKIRGRKWQEAKSLIEPRPYSQDEALDLLKKISYSKFDPTLEAHIRLKRKAKGSLTLPSGERIEFKTDSFNIVHQKLGKLSLGKEKLEKNLKALISALSPYVPLSMTICPTMGPGIKISLDKNF